MHRAFLAAILAIGLPAGLAAQGLLITEFMADNSATLSDFEGSSPDWIEIYNGTGGAVNLAGYALTDNANQPLKWVFPNPVNLGPGQFLVVFASGLDRRVPGQELHTNFNLSTSGEHLSLRTPAGVVLSSFGAAYPPQYKDVSYGLPFVAGSPSGTGAYLSAPTPGAANAPAASILADLAHTPSWPGDNDTILIAVRPILLPGRTLASIQLRYRVHFGAEILAPMNDSGVLGDLVAGDGIYTGQIPMSASAPGQMVRWRVTATDSQGGSMRAPLFPSATNSPEYGGTVIQDPGVSSGLPILQWFVQSPPAAETVAGTRASLFYDGAFYDNIFVRRRGGSSAGYPKKSFKFDFNAGYHMYWSVELPGAEEINLNTTWADKAFIRQNISYDVYRDAGGQSSLSEPVRLMQNGNFHSVAIFVEQVDRRMLAREGLDPRGALYKMYNTCNSSTNGVEKKTRLYENHADLAQLVSAIQQQGSALETWLFDNLNVGAVLNYLAATCLILDNDHVAKNYYLYRDSEDTGEWRFLPWDKDLTLGRNYTLSGGVLNDTMFAGQDPYAHPLFGDQQRPKVDGPWNRLIDAVYRVPRLREMYLCRLRTTMDRILNPPGTPLAERYYESRIAALQGRMAADAALDQSAWGIPNWGAPLDFSAAVNQMLASHLDPRRLHLYQAHGPAGSGLVPAAAASAPGILPGVVEASPVSGNQREEYIQLVNCTPAAVDVSGYLVAAGSILARIPEGTVIAAGDSLYLSPDVQAFRQRTSGPSGGQGLQVVKAWSGDLQPQVPIQIFTSAGVLVAGGPAFSLSTTGVQDVSLSVAFAPPYGELYIPISALVSQPPGCGPFAGLGADAVFTVMFPLGTHPFHVQANAAGQYAFALPPGSLPAGVTIDSRAISIGGPGMFGLSPLVRITF